jgi:hypothetical protein
VGGAERAVERRVEQFQRSGRPTCRRGRKEGERLWFCRQNAEGAEPRVERYPYAFFRGREDCASGFTIRIQWSVIPQRPVWNS